MRVTSYVLFALMLAGAWNHFFSHEPPQPPGVVVSRDPVQIDRTDLKPFTVGRFQLTPAAAFTVEARVLSTEKYYLGREAELSPVDLALGWGPMSDSAVLDQLQISQGGRFYFYRWPDAPPIPPTDIVEHSANMHMIPANDAIKSRLNAVNKGQIVKLSGYLVRVQAADGWRWNSSMTRSDSGEGACELLWVKSITVR